MASAQRPGTVVNISGTTPIEDPTYRYKMPVVYGKIEGRGNGIKTVIPNISEVGTSLHRHPGEVNKFFGCELGAQTTYASETDRAVVNGAHTDGTLQQLIHRYIETFVLCPNCGLPETEYKIKNDTIWHKCAACGAKEMVDMGHKLCTYILAQAKKAKKEGGKKKAKDKDAEEDGKKKKKVSKKDKEDAEDGEKKKKSKSKDKDKEKKKKKKDEDGDEEGGDAEENGDYIKEAMFGKKEKTIDDMADEAAGDDDDEDDDDVAGVDDVGAMNLAVDGTRKFLEENPDASPADIARLVKNQQMASALKSQDKVHIFVRATLTPQFAKEKQIQKHAASIVAITQSNNIMERHLIGAMEALCLSKPKAFPVALKQLYDADALEEETILDWASEGRSEYTLEEVDEESRANLRGEAEPLIVWLQEEDSDEEDEDDE